MNDREKVIKGLECCASNRMRREDCEAMDCAYLDLEEKGCIHQLIRDALALLKAQEPPKNASISSAIECLLHPQDADDSDMEKAIDTAVRAMRSLRDSILIILCMGGLTLRFLTKKVSGEMKHLNQCTRCHVTPIYLRVGDRMQYFIVEC